MTFDFRRLRELRRLNPDDIAHWALEVKLALAVIVALAVGIIGYLVLVSAPLSTLELAQREEQTLRSRYQSRHAMAANLAGYQTQLAQLRSDFDTMLGLLPNSNQTPGLLDDITLVGTSNGLTFQLLHWQPEVPRDFYAELPIQMEVTGQYHQFGQFLGDLAALPRLVTVHDFAIEKTPLTLLFKLSAKTYKTEVASSSPQLAEPVK